MIVDRNDLPGNAPQLYVMVCVLPDQHSVNYVTIGYGIMHLHSEEVDGNWKHWAEVVAKKTNNCLIRFDVRKETKIELQYETIIVVEDHQSQTFKDFSISCAEVTESEYIWRWICEKTGKDFLEIKSGEVLEMPTSNNLGRLLTTVQQRYDLVFYHIRNSPLFMPSLQSVFDQADKSNSLFHLHQLSSIMSHLLRKMQQRNVSSLFSRQNFELLLRVKTYELKIDYLHMWRQRLVIRCLLPLADNITQRIHEYHAIVFYREFLLDYKSDHFLNHILESELGDCCKDIASYFTGSAVMDELVDLAALSLGSSSNTEKTEAEEETFAPEAEALRKKLLSEKKVDFMLQAISITKGVRMSSDKISFYEKMLSSRVLGAVGDLLDQNILKSLDILVALAKVCPAKFLEIAKKNYKDGVEDCYRKMVNKFSFVSEDWQLTILSFFRSLGESLLLENANFVVDSFVVTNIEKYRDERSILLLLAELLDFFQTWKILSQVMQCRVFVYLGQFLTSIQSARPDHHIALRVTKIMKKVIAESARSTIAMPNMPILQQINYQVVQHGFFGFFMVTFQRNAHRNNMVASSAHLIFKMLSSMINQTRYHRYLLKKHRGFAVLEKYFPEIMMPQPATPGLMPIERRESRTEMTEECLELTHRESKENVVDNRQIEVQKQKEKQKVEEMVEENVPTFREAIDLVLPTVLCEPISLLAEAAEQIQEIDIEPINSICQIEPVSSIQFIELFQAAQLIYHILPEPVSPKPISPSDLMQPIENPPNSQQKMDPLLINRPTKRRKQSDDQSNPLPCQIIVDDYDEREGNK